VDGRACDKRQETERKMAGTDASLFLLINRGMANSLLDTVMPFVTEQAHLLLLPFVAWIFIRDRRKAMLAVLLSLISLALSDAITHTLKELIGRPRPFSVIEEARVLVGRGGSFSMPSGHAANSASVIIPVIVLFGGLIRPSLILGALMVSFSRIYVGVHYPSDVVTGIVVGTAAASAVIWAYNYTHTKYREASYFHVLMVILAFFSIFRLCYILTGPLDLSPDEAHYWDWSRRLDLSYYSKGPLIAYMIALGRTVFGNTVLGVRVGAVVLSVLDSIVLFALVRKMFDEKTALVSALLFQCIPLYATYSVIMTIDAPFTFFWILSLYITWIITDRREHGLKTRWHWALLGVTVGLGLLAKYTMAFFCLCTLIYVLTHEKLREYLRKPYPYMAFAVSLVVFSPVLIWNAGHDWVTFRHTAGHAHLSDGFVLSPRHFFEFIGSQLGVVTPLLFIMMWTAIARLRKDGRGRFLMWFSLPVFAFFLLKSIQGKVQANWAMPAYITGIIAFAYYYIKGFRLLSKKARTAVVVAILLTVSLTAISHYPSIIDLPPRLDPTVRLKGWEELGRRISEVAEEMGNEGDYFIFSDRYQVTSELAFYVKGNPVTYCANTGRRMNQYDLWPGFENLTHYNAIFVMIKDSVMPESLRKAFAGCERETLDVVRHGTVIRKFTYYRCYDFKGIERTEVHSY